MDSQVKHPATYTDAFIPIFSELLLGCASVYDPFAGTGKLANIREYGFSGKLCCSEIEPEWSNRHAGIDYWFIGDSSNTFFISSGFFDAVCTSPTYGNRMADSHTAKDDSKRITYTHCLGRKLSDGNTGKTQWGDKYKLQHTVIYKEVVRTLKPNGLFVLNVSDHIRNGVVQKVTTWHVECLKSMGLSVEKILEIATPRMGFGANSSARVGFESIILMRKQK